MSQDYYEILGVARDASADDIRKAYRKLARKLHPDVNPDPETHERFKEVTRAYEVLSDPKKREMYDLGADPTTQSGMGAGAGFGAQGFSFTDIMDAFFGGTGGGGRGPRSRVRRGQDALLRLRIDLKDAVFGGVQDIQVDTAVVCQSCNGNGSTDGSEPVTCPGCSGRGEVSAVQRSFIGQVMTTRPCTQCQGFGTILRNPCTECVGEGRVRSRRNLSVKIPAGVDDGTRIQLASQGEVGPGGGPAGDLYIELEVQPHEIWDRKGSDLHCEVTVPMTAAALGTTIPLQTLDDKTIEVQVEPGTQPADEIVISGEGVPHISRSTRGDVVVHVDIETPTKLDAAQRELLEQLAQMRGEEQPTGKVTSSKRNVFSRIRDAFHSG